MIARNDAPPIIQRPGQFAQGELSLSRPPIPMTCKKCRQTTLVLLPQGPCRLRYTCTCGTAESQEFGAAPEILVEQFGAVKLDQQPILHECDDCGKNDPITVPGRDGSLRWSCSCGSVWELHWRPAPGSGPGNAHRMLARVQVAKGKPKAPPRLNLCQCGLEACPHCNPK